MIEKLKELFSRGRGRASDEEVRALALPPMSRGLGVFALAVVFLLGVGLTAFVLLDPFGIGLLSRDAPAAGAPEVAAAPDSLPLHQCPMHPEVIERGPADCPICGMALVPMQDVEPASQTVQLYQCPMHPEVIEDHEASCPICGMKLTPMDAGVAAESDRADAAGAATTIRIDPVQVQNIGVVSREARIGEISRAVRTVGILDFNADLITWVNTKFSGWVEKVHVTYVGQEVRAGQVLFEIYSPELVTTQEEYLRAIEYKASLEHSRRTEALRQAESLLQSTRDRLVYWDISEDQIATLEQSRQVQRRLAVRAPATGMVTEIMDQALEGMFVEAGMNLYKIADISSLWVHADIYESDLPWVREQQPAVVSFRFEPERVYRGKILFLYPEVSPETRTLKICVEVPNRNLRLRAGMYTDVVIYGPPLRDAILIPDSAVLRSGQRDLVFVDRGEGRFEPREVELGIRGEGNEVQIVSGLAAGEAVVTQAQFMLDSESRVQEAIAKFMRRDSETVP
jgi:Cu(I)/Ag(I) efflux system membrane fusion protein/cobalt-zinc-cadmium efflux system membrane fusion protein